MPGHIIRNTEGLIEQTMRLDYENIGEVETAHKTCDERSVLHSRVQGRRDADHSIVEACICRVYGHGRFFDDVDVVDDVFETTTERESYMRRRVPTEILSDHDCSTWSVDERSFFDENTYTGSWVKCTVIHKREDITVSIDATMACEPETHDTLIEATAVIKPTGQ